jgi:DNA-binding NarL/FixJ family response regulator
MIRIALTIPGSALRAGLRSLLEAGPAFQVIHASPKPESLGKADVWVVTEAISQDEIRREIITAQAGLALLVLGDGDHSAQDYASLPVRAWGVLPVDATVEEMIAAIQALHAGLIVVYPDWVELPLTRRLSGPAGEVEALVEPLTERESEVLQLLAQGLSNKQIAVRLYISEHTVKFHVSSVYGKLGATNRAEAVRLGVQQGLVVL